MKTLRRVKAANGFIFRIVQKSPDLYLIQVKFSPRDRRYLVAGLSNSISAAEFVLENHLAAITRKGSLL